MQKFYYLFIFLNIVLQGSLFSQVAVKESNKDSTVLYVNGQGLQISLGNRNKFTFNINGTIQAGFATNRIDDAKTIKKQNRLSLNLVRFGMNGIGSNGQLTFGILSDFTGTTGILEGWMGFASKNKKYKLIIGERQTNTNNRLAMEDEKFASVLGQTIAGKSIDGSVYGGLMQNFVGSSREGGIWFEPNFSIHKMRIYPSLSMTTGRGQAFFETQDNFGFKYGFRADIMPMGDFIKNNAFIAQDIYFEQKPKLAIGFAASYNVKATNSIGAGNGTVNGVYNDAGNIAYPDYKKIVADFIFKYNGFSFVGEYIDGSISGKNLFTDVAGTIKYTPETMSTKYSTGSAFNLQSSYVFKSGWSLEGRFAHVAPEFKFASSIIQTQNWYTFNINKYAFNNAIRIGVNTTYIKENGAASRKSSWVNNLAVQMIF